MDHVEVLVIGAGVLGLACARALAQAGREVMVTERAPCFGSGVSSRSSEVIHAGLYYPEGSLKARLCVRGKALLYEFCESRGVPLRRCGKLVVASDEQGLLALAEQARRNGVADLELLSRRQALAMEPALECAAALWSPSSGIVDSHALMAAVLADAEAVGARLAVASPFVSAERLGQGWRVRVGAGYELRADWLVNAAGLEAQAVARAMHGFAASAIPRRWLAKGQYFSLQGRAPFSRLIYPLPVDGGLGVHLTLDLGGQARFGPDVQWLPDDGAALDYSVDAQRAAMFAAEVRRYWPGLPADALMPGYSGIRPKLSGPGEPAADFRIDGPARHGCPGVVQLLGIESPGLTACLAIGEEVVAAMAQ